MRVGLNRLPVVLLATLSVTLAGCGDDEEQPTGPAEVVITEDGYEPAELTVEAGERVVFVNRAKVFPGSAKDDSGGYIDVSPQPGPTKHDGSEVNRASKKGFATHALFAKERQTVIFPVPHKYEYYSAFNPDLTGTIEVTPRGQ